MAKALEIEKLKLQIARLRRTQFGRSSERIERTIEQLELMLEELETELPAPAAATPAPEVEQSSSTKSKRSGRKPLPEHLPRREVRHEPSCTCPACGGEMRKVGEDVTEILDYIPGHFEVIKHIRPAFSCRRCESMVQTPIRCSVSMSLGRCARSNRMRESYQRCVIAVTSRIASESKSRGYPAACGCHVRTGIRQSMPSNNMPSWAGVSAAMPSAGAGQTKRPFSNRFANRQSPCPSHHSALSRYPRRPRNTKIWPPNGSRRRLSCTAWPSRRNPCAYVLLHISAIMWSARLC